MPRFEVEIEGAGLGAAMAALNESGIPTIASGGWTGPDGTDSESRRSFFRSGTFLVLVVIVVAFLAQRIIAPPDEPEARSYGALVTQIERNPRSIESVTLEPDDSAMLVVERGGDEYTSGYPPSTEPQLIDLLRQQRIEVTVEESGGASLLSWLVYIAPFVLILVFWLFLMRRMRQDRTTSVGAPASSEPQRLKAVVDAGSAESAEARVRDRLVGGSWRIGPARSWG